jgi:predicted nucleic acid-binding protein
VAKGKTVTIRVSEETFDEVKQVCSELGETYNFNQFVNQSLAAILDVIHHQGSDIPVPRFAMMARLMRDFEEKKFSESVKKK